MQEILRGKSSMTAGAVVPPCIATASNMEVPLKNDRFARSTVADAAFVVALRGLATRLYEAVLLRRNQICMSDEGRAGAVVGTSS